MKEILSRIVFIVVDILSIILSIVLAFYLRGFVHFFEKTHTIPLSQYLTLYPLYIVVLIIFTSEGVYTRRYDFWHETRLILKALLYSLVIVLAYLALSKTIEDYSRAVIILSFLFMAFFIPLLKRSMKITLHKLGIWKKPAVIYGQDELLRREIFTNPYLGYVDALENEPKTVFINSAKMDHYSLRKVIDEQIRTNHEVIFIPLLNDFDLTQSQIYELSNARTNLISLQNRLKSRLRRAVKLLFDMLLAILLLPVLLPVMAIIALFIKKEEPEGSIFFRQERLGKDGKLFVCYKFRTMKEDSEKLLQDYLSKHPEEIEYYEKYHKYINDPRVTKIGAFLRKTSLDELPQIFNVLKVEMSFVGPRPYMPNEKDKIGESFETIAKVRPGITGLWQVSGRSEIDFYSRVEMDVWYIRNWNLWMDIVILTKTAKAVLAKEGAY